MYAKNVSSLSRCKKFDTMHFFLKMRNLLQLCYSLNAISDETEKTIEEKAIGYCAYA